MAPTLSSTPKVALSHTVTAHTYAGAHAGYISHTLQQHVGAFTAISSRGPTILTCEFEGCEDSFEVLETSQQERSRQNRKRKTAGVALMVFACVVAPLSVWLMASHATDIFAVVGAVILLFTLYTAVLSVYRLTAKPDKYKLGAVQRAADDSRASIATHSLRVVG